MPTVPAPYTPVIGGDEFDEIMQVFAKLGKDGEVCVLCQDENDPVPYTPVQFHVAIGLEVLQADTRDPAIFRAVVEAGLVKAMREDVLPRLMAAFDQAAKEYR